MPALCLLWLALCGLEGGGKYPLPSFDTKNFFAGSHKSSFSFEFVFPKQSLRNSGVMVA